MSQRTGVAHHALGEPARESAVAVLRRHHHGAQQRRCAMRLDAGDCDDAVFVVHDLEMRNVFRDALRWQTFGSQERLHGRQVGGGRSAQLRVFGHDLSSAPEGIIMHATAKERRMGA